MQPVSYAHHQFPPEIIRRVEWLYLRFSLSYRDVEELLAERGIQSFRVPPVSCRPFLANSAPIHRTTGGDARPGHSTASEGTLYFTQSVSLEDFVDSDFCANGHQRRVKEALYWRVF